MAALYRQVEACDGILEGMEAMLSEFQSHLGDISGEIHSLQEQSVDMNVRLKNRRKVQGPLNELVTKLTLPPELINALSEQSVGSEFETAARELHIKLQFVSTQGSDVAAVQDVEADLMALSAKACSTIREFFLGKIQTLRKPMSNPQVPQEAMLKHKQCFDFLHRYAKSAAAEVRTEYLNTISKVHASYFKAYLQKLLKLQLTDANDKDDLLGGEAVTKKTGFFSSKPTTKNKQTTFTLGARAAVLEQFDEPILLPHAVKEVSANDPKMAYENIFRSYQKAMTDVSAREFLFCTEFFGVKESKAYEYFKEAMGKSISFILRHLETHMATSFDAIGILLCLRINIHYRAYVESKDVKALRAYFDKSDELLWTAFTRVMKTHVASVVTVDPSKLRDMDTRPHYIVRRYAEFSGGMIQLKAGHSLAPVDEALASMQNEIMNLILRIAAEFTDSVLGGDERSIQGGQRYATGAQGQESRVCPRYAEPWLWRLDWVCEASGSSLGDRQS
eukprot:TRINITY_DN10000_c0_g1_i3.p1 TRINITY_DN10000_c0_g1~~TRINITY_DN10000_c0_g1_i3.p1  ORF type:complete len:591 (+),score=136.48 TRINITY_DN10000_c0_g1_i3:260-1774(+)